ncbi:NAD(P)-dependent malic enzyme [Mariniplasma anaerobium]|uniref:Malate dehydrogenase n=1 Tax=Mariniplasma anaerobium TaxID=2735436 RepID=A0A7U9XW19_9MOLU|nr:NADP-dependent malic enzyme [Mariniplasma anaerobium]BCR36168.1 malate dehydrogenase [Mariniplasma anaerobium]
MDIMEKSLELHRKLKGKIAIRSTYPIKNKKDLALVYTPGVASSCLAIKDNKKEVYNLTAKNNTVAVISDGTAVLGLGDIGALAAIPVMEGKCAIFKEFADINAIPIVLDTKDVDELVKTISHLAPSFGGINLEDISAPRCFEVEKRLRDMLDIPVFHDDQHGTAIAVGAALINALRVVDIPLDKAKIVINGAGSAGIAISSFLIELGVKNLIVCDKNGILDPSEQDLNDSQILLSQKTNQKHVKGSLADALKGADAFIGVSVGNVVNKDMVKLMDKEPIIFALANPTPEISRDDALEAGAKIYGAGISNIPNQINNALVFPGLFKGALAHPVKQIDTEMEKAACHALAGLVSDKELSAEYIIPDVFNKDVVKVICKAIIDVKASQ